MYMCLLKLHPSFVLSELNMHLANTAEWHDTYKNTVCSMFFI